MSWINDLFDFWHKNKPKYRKTIKTTKNTEIVSKDYETTDKKKPKQVRQRIKTEETTEENTQ